MIDTQDDVFLECILQILFNISEYSDLNSRLNTLVLNNALDPLIRLIPGTFPPVQNLALRLCGSLSDHQDFQTALRENGAISEIISVISAQNSNLSSALYLVRKICELNQANSLAVIEIGGIGVSEIPSNNKGSSCYLISFHLRMKRFKLKCWDALPYFVIILKSETQFPPRKI
jgi:hypothetical protein